MKNNQGKVNIVLLIIIVLVIAGGIWFFTNKKSSISTDPSISNSSEKHIYENSKYGFYFDMPNVNVTPLDDYKEAFTYAVFDFWDTTITKDSVPIGISIDGDPSTSVKEDLKGFEYLGKETINSIVFDHYSSSDGSGKTVHVYVTTKNNLEYNIGNINPGDIKYFGFLN